MTTAPVSPDCRVPLCTCPTQGGSPFFYPAAVQVPRATLAADQWFPLFAVHHPIRPSSKFPAPIEQRSVKYQHCPAIARPAHAPCSVAIVSWTTGLAATRRPVLPEMATFLGFLLLTIPPSASRLQARRTQ